MLEALLDRFHQKDRLALSRLLSLVARGEHLEEIQARLGPVSQPSRVVAITGSGGVGKSTLIGKLIEWLRQQGPSVAVLACDPQSPVSGGALLGDRFRMTSRPDDAGVFIRSLAAVSGQGAIARHLATLVRLLEVFEFEVILLETVGAGQGDTAVRDLADVVVLLLQPETGDELQWEKAGILEVVDIVVIHKADLPGADRVEAQVRSALDLAGHRPVPVIRVSSRTTEGIAALGTAIAECPSRRPSADDGGILLRLAQETLAIRYTQAEAEGDPRFQQILSAWRQQKYSSAEAVALLLHFLGNR